MGKILKWLLIIVSVFFVLIIAAIIIIPQFIDVQKYKPVIEQKVSKATGRSFTLGDEIEISLFPWVGVKLTDIHFGSGGAGYKEIDMVSVEKFEVRLKVLPLLLKQIEVKTFVLDSPKIFLEKLKNGDANWQGIGNNKRTDRAKKRADKDRDRGKKESEPAAGSALPIKGLIVDNFSIKNGQLIYIDHGTDLKKQISDLTLNLKNISLENPIGVSFNAKIDSRPISLEGTAGPIGKNPGKGTIALDFVLKALDLLEVELKGDIIDPIANQTIDLELNVLPFSPRELFAAMDVDLPVQTKDPKVLNLLSLQTHIKGNPKGISLSKGHLGLDDSKLNFSVSAKDFAKPDLMFDIQLDKIDLDRYLPDSTANKEVPVAGKTSKVSSGKIKSADSIEADSLKKTIDYDHLRKLILDGKIKVGKLIAGKAVMEDVDISILARNGIITVEPLDLNLYQGSMASKLVLNVQKNRPKTKISITAQGIQAGKLIKDVFEKQLIKGALKTDITLSMVGDNLDIIKKTLTGKGEILFTDGALSGIDLTNMVQNVTSAFGIGGKKEESPRTDFASLKIPFTAKNGLVNTEKSSLISPLLRLFVKGKANLVNEKLDFRVEPKFVATLQGQGDTKQRLGVMVPVLITGSFSSPKIRPDLQGILQGDIIKDISQFKDISQLKKGLGLSSSSKKERKAQKESLKKEAVKQLEGLLYNIYNKN